MTRSEPRPRSVRGTSRARAKRTMARSSNRLRTSANRSAGPPTRMVVKRASGSWRDVLTPSRRWMSVPRRSASCLGQPARSRTDARSGRHTSSREERSTSSAAGSARRSARAMQQVARDPRGARPAERPAGDPHPVQLDAVRTAARPPRPASRASNRVVGDQPRGTGRDHLAGVGLLVPRGVGIGHHDHGQADGGRLGERRGAGPPDQQVRCHERVGHVLAQERIRSIAATQLGRQPVPARLGRGEP